TSHKLFWVHISQGLITTLCGATRTRVATLISALSNNWHRPPNGVSSTSYFWPKGSGCANNAAKFTISMWLVDQTPYRCLLPWHQDRKSTRLNSSHVSISYA